MTRNACQTNTPGDTAVFRNMLLRHDLGSNPALASLSHMEQRIAARLMRFRSDIEISRDLGIGMDGLKEHLCAIYKKLGISRRSELIALLS